MARGLSQPLTLTMRSVPGDIPLHWTGKSPPSQLIEETTPLGPVQVPAGSFFQVNSAIASALLTEFMNNLEHVDADRAIDMYGGVGLFGLAAALRGIPLVVVVDSDPAAATAARNNAERLHLTGVKAESGTAEHRLERVLAAGKAHRTLLVVDPPRAGLSKPVVQSILENNPGTIAYVSCAPDTLTRDLKLLVTGGYAIRSTRLFDMFPCTPYFESLTWLRRPGI